MDNKPEQPHDLNSTIKDVENQSQQLQQAIKLNKTVAELSGAVSVLEDAIINLQIFVKYQQFDLEATRRERDQLKKKLEEKNG
jgi:hypothetical protein